jgi:hypothetical protein
MRPVERCHRETTMRVTLSPYDLFWLKCVKSNAETAISNLEVFRARAKALSVGLPNAYFKSLGLPSLVEAVTANLLEPPCTDPVCTVVWQGSAGNRHPYARSTIRNDKPAATPEAQYLFRGRLSYSVLSAGTIAHFASLRGFNRCLGAPRS